jgi:hypothetical protein
VGASDANVHLHASFLTEFGSTLCGSNGIGTMVTMTVDNVTCIDCKAILLMMQDDSMLFATQRNWPAEYWRIQVIEVRSLIDEGYSDGRLGLLAVLERLENIVDRHQQ